MLKDILSPKYRKIVYTTYSLSGLLLGAIQVGFVAAAVAQPMALTVALAVYAYLGVGLGFVARANTPSQTPAEGPLSDE